MPFFYYTCGMYSTFQPHPLLAAYVDAYWVSTATQFSQQRILPDTCADIIFNISDQPVTAGNNAIWIAPNTAFVVGTMTAFRDIARQGNTSMLGIRFKPGGLHAFTTLPLQLATDEHLLLSDITRDWHTRLEPLLEKARSIPEKVDCLENFLLQRLPANNTVANKIQECIHLIHQSNGNITPAMLADKAFMSPRTFERNFLQMVGVSPKTFSRIVRFMSVRRELKKEKSATLLSLALERGFYDHAHLTREFKLLAGDNPSCWR